MDGWRDDLGRLRRPNLPRRPEIRSAIMTIRVLPWGTSLSVLAAISWIAAAPAAEPEPAESTSAASAAASPMPLDEAYQDPEAVSKHFSAELARLAKREPVVSPAELADQAEEATTYPLETLPDPGKKLGPEEVYARARPSVVIVGGVGKPKKDRSRQAYCAAGFVLRQDGIIATNYHVITTFQDMRAVGVMTHDGRVFPVKRVLAGDKHGDVAVLKIDATGLTPLPIASDVAIGATVYCLSHPVLSSAKTENAFYAFTQGIVSGKYRLRIGNDEPVAVLTVSTDYAVGSSGAPILNEHGAAVGMACQTLPIVHDLREADVQMIWKFTRPASTLLAILKEKEKVILPPATIPYSE
jgi:serine protease Do